MTDEKPKDTRPIVLGVAGGVGAGKSTVARAFARLGFVVVDSDAEAKAALDRPEVRDQLVSWWGEQILGPDGRIDRKAVGRIVFADETQRRRLEGLTHPLVRRTRAQAMREAADARAPGVVIDAPLLFEAGLDAECDVVVFVDAPLDTRLRRVRDARGWDEAEHRRREAAQMPLEEKRARSRFVVQNSAGDLAEVERQCRAVYDAIRAERALRP